MPVEVTNGRARSTRKTSLLQAAADLFAGRGYHAVSTDDIGRAVGISGPGVYRHFASKSDVLRTLCDSAMDHLLDGARAAVAGARDSEAVLAEMIDLHVDFAVRQRVVLAVYVREQQELPAKDLRALRKRQREYESFWRDAIAARSSMSDGDVRALVKLLLSMLNGTAHVKENIPRSQLVALLKRMAIGALDNAGVSSSSEPRTSEITDVPGPVRVGPESTSEETA